MMNIPPAMAKSQMLSSRPSSRKPSPVHSRKSYSYRRKPSHMGYRNNDTTTDDEDSSRDEDSRSIISTYSNVSRCRPGNRDYKDYPAKQLPGSKHTVRRRGSTQTEFAAPPAISGHKTDFQSSTKSSRIYSDLDSESSCTRALVQAIIQQKLTEEETANKKSSTKSHSKGHHRSSKIPTKTSQKQTTGVQTNSIVKAKPTKSLNEEAKNHGTGEKHLEEKVHVESLQENSQSTEVKYENLNQLVTEHPEQEAEMTEEDNKDEMEKDARADTLGPPPATPDFEWCCEFCTFVNEPKTKICGVCCKTPVTAPQRYSTKSAGDDKNPAVQKTLEAPVKSK